MILAPPDEVDSMMVSGTNTTLGSIMSTRTIDSTTTDANLAPVDTAASSGQPSNPIQVLSDSSDDEITFRHSFPDWDSADDELPLCKF